MSDDRALEKAIEDGVLSSDQAARLKGYLDREKGGLAANASIQSGDPEDLRFLASFNDIFLSVGLTILLIAVALIAGVVLVPSMPLGWSAPLTAVAVALASWGLAEYFGARRRMLLPTMTLASAFSLAIGAAIGALAVKFGVDGTASEVMNTPLNEDAFENAFRGVEDRVERTNYAAAIGGGLAALAFYGRFRLPFSLFIVAVSAAWLFYSVLINNLGMTNVGWGAIVACGLLTLVAAMAFDMTDPERKTRQADSAFWLHLAAAPQLMFGLKGMVLGPGADFAAAEAITMLALLVMVAMLSLAINRRAPIFAGLVSFILVTFNLASAGGLSGVYAVAVPLLVTGLSVVLLGAGWGATRKIVLGMLPNGGVWDRLFPPEHLIESKLAR